MFNFDSSYSKFLNMFKFGGEIWRTTLKGLHGSLGA